MTPATAVAAPTAPAPGTGERVPNWLKTAAGWAWRLLILVAAAVVIARGVMGVSLVVAAIFLALVAAAVLRPLVNLLDRAMPRALATVIAYVLGVAVLVGLGTFVGVSIAGQADTLSHEFLGGLAELNKVLRKAPKPLRDIDLSNVGGSIVSWVETHSDQILSEVSQRAGDIVTFGTAIVLAIFCSVYFVKSGKKMWGWFTGQLSDGARRRWQVAGQAAWHTFSAYTRGLVLVAAANGILSGAALAILRVPLAVPLGVLVFLGTFVPLIGAAVAMVLAVFVALAAKGWIIALVVVALIALIGQIEGHLLQPLIMSRQVRVHPVVVAISVVGGTVLAGVLGAIAAVPVVSTAWAVYKALRDDQRRLRAAGLPDDGTRTRRAGTKAAAETAPSTKELDQVATPAADGTGNDPEG
jgi:predicted PurR-regulated permease PerM